MKRTRYSIVALLLAMSVCIGATGCMVEVVIPPESEVESTVSNTKTGSTEESTTTSSHMSTTTSLRAESSTSATQKQTTKQSTKATVVTSSIQPTTTVPYTYTMQTFYPDEDSQVVLHNPDMGWVLYDNFIISKSESAAHSSCPTFGYDFPGVDYVMLKFTWADIEKSKGEYNFVQFDYIYDYWTKRGKTISLGMSADSLLWYGSNGTGIPKYVTDALPESSVQNRQYQSTTMYYTLCDAREPYYQERLQAFLKAMADHMKETGRTADYIDLRGHGLWGEWHTGYQYASVEDRREALNDVMRIWSGAFPDAWLALPYSYDPDEPRMNYTMSQYYDRFLEWSAFDLALNYKNITLRRDGCGGAIQVNERTYCENVFSTLDRGPFTAEGAGGYTDHNSAKYIVEDGLTLHPNYFTIVGWTNQQAKDFINKESELFNYGLRNMGYRFVPTEIRTPDRLAHGKDMELSIRMINRAVGRAMRDYSVKVILTDSKGNQVAVMDAGKLPTSTYILDQEYEAVSLKAKVPSSLKKGTYSLSIALYDGQTARYVGMAVKDTGAAKDTGGVCVGQVEVV